MMRSRRAVPLFCVLAAAALVGCHRPAGSGPNTSTPTAIAPEGPPLLHVTPKAAEMFRHFAAESGEAADGLYLRVRVVPGGCQGFMHKLDLEPTITAEDHVFHSGGVRVVVFTRQADMLRGAEVDFVEENGQRGFKVENPNFKGDWAGKWLPILEQERDVK